MIFSNFFSFLSVVNRNEPEPQRVCAEKNVIINNLQTCTDMFLFTEPQFIWNTLCTPYGTYLLISFSFNSVSCAVIVFLTKHNFILKSEYNIIVPRLGDKYIFSQVCYQTSLRT